VPNTVENFAGLTLGAAPGGTSYRGAPFHRIVSGVLLQGGDVVSGDGARALLSRQTQRALLRACNHRLSRHTLHTHTR
jgi:cyclophilin family peptidyl-prolyl cis-trans isomerase